MPQFINRISNYYTNNESPPEGSVLDSANNERDIGGMKESVAVACLVFGLAVSGVFGYHIGYEEGRKQERESLHKKIREKDVENRELRRRLFIPSQQ